MIGVEDVVVRRGESIVVDRVCLAAADGRTVGIVGPNGSGKSTLLSTIYRAVTPCSGTVVIDGAALSELGRRDVARKVAVVAQEADGEIPLSVYESVQLGRLPHRGRFGGRSTADDEAVSQALERVGIMHLAGRRISELSGGERQRTLIARAIAQDATHLLLDEPTNHLDIRHQHQTLSLVRQIATSCIVVLHDLNLALQYCDEVILLDRGHVVGAGVPRDVLDPTVLCEVYGVSVTAVNNGDDVLLAFGLADGAARFEHPSSPT